MTPFLVMIEPLDSPHPGVLGFKLSGKLHDEDYQHFEPAVDAAIAAHGKVRLLAHFVDFHGWDLAALWNDLKFAANHCTKVERIAIVGDHCWEKWMSKICLPFTLAEIRWFDSNHLVAAWRWVEEETAPTTE